MTGIAIPLSEAPEDLARGIPGRVYDRDGRRELRFFWQQSPTLLPVWWDGAVRLLRWGSKDRRGPLPYGPWVAEELLRGGALAHCRPESAVIPANLGFDRGTWFLIEEGVAGVVLPGVPGGPVVYVLTRPSTNYYRNMAGRCEVMPVLVNQTI